MTPRHIHDHISEPLVQLGPVQCLGVKYLRGRPWKHASLRTQSSLFFTSIILGTQISNPLSSSQITAKTCHGPTQSQCMEQHQIRHTVQKGHALGIREFTWKEMCPPPNKKKKNEHVRHRHRRYHTRCTCCLPCLCLLDQIPNSEGVSTDSPVALSQRERERERERVCVCV